MDWILQFFTGFFQNESTMRLVVVGVASLTAFLLMLGVSYLVLGATDPVRRRLGRIRPEHVKGGRFAVNVSTLVGPVSEYVLPKEELERNKMVRQLAHAGFRAPNALSVFYGLKTLLSVVFPLVALVLLQAFTQLSTVQIFFGVMVAAFIGMTIPNMALRSLRERRLKALRNAFPDALDLLVVCVESGLGLAPSLQRVAEELSVSHPELANELAVVNAETRAGVEREVALKNLADRTGLDDIRGLVSLLVQTMRFGTSVADALRVYSEEFRDKRMQKAEEKAAKVGTKLIFPLVLCLFPSFFIVAVGPAVIRIVDAFSRLTIE